MSDTPRIDVIEGLVAMERYGHLHTRTDDDMRRLATAALAAIADAEKRATDAEQRIANSALDAKRLRVLMQWGLRHSTDSLVSDPANPYYVALRLPGRGSCSAHGATLAEVADRAIEWLEAK